MKVKSSLQLQPLWHPKCIQLCFGGFRFICHRYNIWYVLANLSWAGAHWVLETIVFVFGGGLAVQLLRCTHLFIAKQMNFLFFSRPLFGAKLTINLNKQQKKQQP